MQLDPKLVKSERQNRAWSQEHLAHVAGLGLRTIQRIEKTGAASFESAQALASVLSIPLHDLSGGANSMVATRKEAKRYGFLTHTFSGLVAICLVASGTMLVANTSWAEKILLDVGIVVGEEDARVGRLLTVEGKEAEMRIDELLRFVITPTIQDDGRVLLTAKIYEFRGDKFVLSAEPKLITANKKEAEIRISSEAGKAFSNSDHSSRRSLAIEKCNK